MALLDFIKDRNQQTAALKTPGKAPSQTPTQDAPKADVTKALSPAELARFRELGARLDKATAHSRTMPQPVAGDDSSRAALLQKQSNQDKTQAALSPTDSSKGQTIVQKKSRGWER